MTQSYDQFCPVAMAAEILCSRWTILLIRELLAGSTRFNDLRRGVPRMSPALLSQRLKELEAAGIVARRPVKGDAGTFEYAVTRAGEELRPIVMAFGVWGQRWIDSDLTLENLDPSLLMWDMRRNLNCQPMPKRRSTIEFMYPDAPKQQREWWLVVTPGEEVDLCSINPGFDVDLYVSSDLRTMTAIWMGYEPLKKALRAGQVKLTGDKQLAQNIESWLALSPFAKEKSALG